ncbi:hypothetical protein SPBR_06301 [Sporothrix brasiliensis 5110]|uniref:Uncharacterized protein n=1 Tax=Sporothrix brasiliensis 5110 TaxID=1398154 RepID=A0A0C2FU49_9PEZI|nr:uncharacterized protein SPBR_06301 [Sporothrix brasiliensis 5110]KIH94533.1 hypothetical protein SPBR_06301 [Sporothrix brasiliensis 5110]
MGSAEQHLPQLQARMASTQHRASRASWPRAGPGRAELPRRRNESESVSGWSRHGGISVWDTHNGYSSRPASEAKDRIA